MNRPEYIIVHHSASKDRGTLDFDDLWHYHVKERGWTDIGYHFVIEQLPFCRPTVLMGRLPEERGAHCSGYNDRSLGVCFVGDFTDARVPDDQWRLGVRLVKWLMGIYQIGADKVCGHRDFKATECPGRYFSIYDFRTDLDEMH